LRARLARQELDITTADRTVAQWRQQIEDMVIRAPFDGVVTTKDAQPGEMISPVSAGGGFTRTGICTVVDMNSLEIELDVNESYINRVEPASRRKRRWTPILIGNSVQGHRHHSHGGSPEIDR
jgi:HlyD family secretion protein